MSVGDFNSKLESFGCTKKNTSCPMFKNIQKQLNLIYLNNDKHTYMDRSTGNTDLSDMAFISPNLAKHDTKFQIVDDLGSDHLPIESLSQLMVDHIEIHPLTTLSTNSTRLTFESTLEAALGSEDFSGLTSTSDLDKYADFIVTAISTAVDRVVPKSKSTRTESDHISDETLALSKEKRRHRRQYSQIKDPAAKTRINQWQKQVKEDLRVETQAS